VSFENILLEREEAVAILTINRPAVLNAVNSATLDELRRAILQLKEDSGVRAIVLTGAGEKAFVAGADVKEFASNPLVKARDFCSRGQHVYRLIEKIGKPTIAAINGYALGGGCELALSCSMRIAADTARIGLPEITLGILPGYGGTQRLPRLIGTGKAIEMMLTGAPVSAADAERIGLVNRVVPAASLMAEARKLAQTIAAQPAVSVRFILDAVNNGIEMGLDDACAYEATLFGLITATEDMKEGTTAFLEKRRPVFTGK
jgi:enoyl-CoA hydratase